jgi:hypothetical protein
VLQVRIALRKPLPILQLLRRVRDLRRRYKAAGYAVTRWGSVDPKWRC